jgi:hypothetical protein
LPHVSTVPRMFSGGLWSDRHGVTERNPALEFSRASIDPGDFPQDRLIPGCHSQISSRLFFAPSMPDSLWIIVAGDKFSVFRQGTCNRQGAVAGKGADLDRPLRIYRFCQQRQKLTSRRRASHVALGHFQSLLAQSALDFRLPGSDVDDIAADFRLADVFHEIHPFARFEAAEKCG